MSSIYTIKKKAKTKSASPFYVPCTHTPGHEVRKAPVVLLVKEQVADPATERLFVIFIVDDLQHGLGMA